MKLYGVYREYGYLELVALVKAETLEQAKEKAMAMGFGKEYRVEEDNDEL